MDTFAPEIIDVEEQQALAMSGEVHGSDLSGFFGTAFTAVMSAVQSTDVDIVGPPFGYYPTMPGETTVVEAGVPVSAPVDDIGEIHPLVLPGGRAASVVHTGPYDTMGETYRALEAWMEENELVPADGMWEIYLTDPGVEPNPETWRTQIVWPIL